MKWLGKWWRNRQRAMDLYILWPACKAGADEIYTEKDQAIAMARLAFRAHCVMDDAWTKDMTVAEISEHVGRLV